MKKKNIIIFLKFIRIYQKLNVSIPNIYENDDVNNILIIEDFGTLTI